MKTSILLFGLLLVSLFSCSDVIKEPEYLGMENTRVTKITSTEVYILSDVKYHNGNLVPGSVQNMDIEVLIDGRKVASVLSTSFDIPANSEFSIPLEVKIPIADIWKKRGGMLASVLSSIVNKKVVIEYKGHLDIDLKAIDYRYELQEKQEIEINLKAK